MATQTLHYATFDVFTTDLYAGNPLAIVYLPASEALTQQQKLKVAKEFNLAETVFMHPSDGDETRIDIFMVDAELPFAGHPTVGSAISVKGASKTLEPKILVTKAGPIPVTYELDGAATMRAVASIPHNIRKHNDSFHQKDLYTIQPALRQVPNLPDSFPVVSIVKGMTFALVRLDSTATLDRVRPESGLGPHNFVKLDDDWPSAFIGSYFYVIDASKSRTNSIFADCRMVEALLEDPATGSAACTLASHLALEGYRAASHLKEFRFEFTQGERMGRKSDIAVIVEIGSNGSVESVRLSGSAVQVMAGTLLI